jgi:hypothetical protein
MIDIVNEETKGQFDSVWREKQRVNSLFSWTTFSIVSVTSTMENTSVEDLARNFYEPQLHTWECARYCTFP